MTDFILDIIFWVMIAATVIVLVVPACIFYEDYCWQRMLDSLDDELDLTS